MRVCVRGSENAFSNLGFAGGCNSAYNRDSNRLMVAAHETVSSRRLRPISFLLKVMPQWAFHVLERGGKKDGLNGGGGGANTEEVGRNLRKGISAPGDVTICVF